VALRSSGWAQNQTSANQVDWNSNIYVQFSGPDLMATTPRIAVNNASGADQAMPEIVATNDGGFVVTWTDERGDANGSGAMAQRFDDGWVRLGEAMVVNTSAQGDQSDAAIAALSNGNLVIAWEFSTGNGSGAGIMALTPYDDTTAQYVVATDAAERLQSGALADTLFGGGDDGADTLIGDLGDDFLFGSSSANDLRDVIYRGDGNDNIDGCHVNDELRGDLGNDTVAGGFGADTVIGGAGDDVLTGSAFGDLMFGSDGNDFINGGFGFDRVNGGGGTDKFYHLGLRDHGSDWNRDYNAAEGDVLQFGGAANTSVSDLLIQRATTANAGAAGVPEIVVTQISTGSALCVLLDGAGQAEINIQIGANVFDLLS
jgi:Ca2+-binding RTX toxin-like protein